MTLSALLTARAALHQFFTKETVDLHDMFVLNEKDLASTNFMPVFRPAGATNKMAVEWKRKMGVSVWVQVDVMRYKNAKGPRVSELYLINRSLYPDRCAAHKEARNPKRFITRRTLLCGLYEWCDADSFQFSLTGEHLDPKSFPPTWFPGDRLSDGRIAYADCCSPVSEIGHHLIRLRCAHSTYYEACRSVRAMKKVPLR
ncbi:MAG: hypothetical protein G01um101417_157 [Parcubacteria group bacterium Gr01-1014_17]|nr:MAG: hypothetical protein G01um101417_157 [Parcubacteria group bacterium Gr01-1014_17]